MILFNGLDQIVMRVIEQTAHTQGDTDEQRFDNVMQALFGIDKTMPKENRRYPMHIKPPTEFSHAEVLWVVNANKNGTPLEKAIKEIIKEGATKKADDDVAFERLKQHLRRYKKHYESFVSIDLWQDLEPNEYFSEEDIKKLKEDREKIFQALSDAGW
ncbi:MAG: hypothetical protein KA155_00435 [Alphaproteobacteria bacterium]|jgi:predicted RNase H-like HicB family nuclease|nr:hypothetical protein [Alphaproteobacteria bacterium]